MLRLDSVYINHLELGLRERNIYVRQELIAGGEIRLRHSLKPDTNNSNMVHKLPCRISKQDLATTFAIFDPDNRDEYTSISGLVAVNHVGVTQVRQTGTYLTTTFAPYFPVALHENASVLIDSVRTVLYKNEPACFTSIFGGFCFFGLHRDISILQLKSEQDCLPSILSTSPANPQLVGTDMPSIVGVRIVCILDSGAQTRLAEMLIER